MAIKDMIDHKVQHEMLGIYGFGARTVLVGDGGQFSTLQAALDSIDMTDTYTSEAGVGTLTTLDINTRDIVGVGTNFLANFFSGSNNYLLIAGDTKAYRVNGATSATAATLSVPRVEASISGSPTFTLITPRPITIQLTSSLAAGGTISGALGFITIDFNGFSIDTPLYTHLESGKLILRNWEGIEVTNDPSGLDGFAYLSALTPSIGSGRAPENAVTDYAIINCNLTTIDYLNHDIIYIASSGDWNFISSSLTIGKFDLFRLGARGLVRSSNLSWANGSCGGTTCAGFKHDLGGVLNMQRSSTINKAVHKNAHVTMQANDAANTFIQVSTMADEEYHNCVFEVTAGSASAIGNSSVSGYISSQTLGGASNSMALDFYNCDIIHEAGVSEGGYAGGFGVVIYAQTITLRFHNSDVFPGILADVLSNVTWVVEHHGSRGGQVAVGAADRTAQMQHCGKTFMFDTTAASRTLTLPPAAWCKYGRITAQKTTNEATNHIVFDGNGAETINGAATQNSPTTAYAAMTVESDGVAWRIVSKLT